MEILKTMLMISIAVLIVLTFALVSPKNLESQENTEFESVYKTDYVLQDLVRTYDLTKDSGVLSSLENNYCDYN